MEITRPPLPADIVALIEANARERAERDAMGAPVGATIRCYRCGTVGEECEMGMCFDCAR